MNLFKRWFCKKEPKLTPIGITIGILKAVDPNSLRSVFSSDMSIYRVHTYFNNIVEYSKFLKEVTYSLEYSVLISTQKIPTDIKVLYKRDFYVDSKNRYIDPVSSSKEFIDLAIRFLTLYEEKEVNDRDYNTERNLYLLNGVISNIHILSKEL